jgi:predicted transcriptional regulator
LNTPKLEVCISILQVLNNKGQLSTSKIASTTRISRSLLGECISILAGQGMLEEKEHRAPVYTITESGRNVLNFFKIDSILESKKALSAQK